MKGVHVGLVRGFGAGEVEVLFLGGEGEAFLKKAGLLVLFDAFTSQGAAAATGRRAASTDAKDYTEEGQCADGVRSRVLRR